MPRFTCGKSQGKDNAMGKAGATTATAGVFLVIYQKSDRGTDKTKQQTSKPISGRKYASTAIRVFSSVHYMVWFNPAQKPIIGRAEDQSHAASHSPSGLAPLLLASASYQILVAES